MFKKILQILFFHILILSNRVESSNLFLKQLFAYYSNDSQSMGTESMNIFEIFTDKRVLS